MSMIKRSTIKQPIEKIGSINGEKIKCSICGKEINISKKNNCQKNNCPFGGSNGSN